MPTIDEIFAAMPAEAVADAHEYLVIDPATRTITVPESEKVFGVEGDGDAERKYFLCTRYVGNGLDLASMFLTINYRNAQGEEDGYLVTDVAVVGDNVTFSWEIWPNVVAFKGTIQFAVCADLPNTSSRRGPDWNTTLAQGEVLEGLDPDRGDVLGETSDVVTQLRAETAAQTEAVEATGAAQVAAVKAAATATTQEAVAAVQAQGAATNASIPAEYAELEATVDRLTRDRAAAIVCEAEGTTIQVTDASNDPLQGLRIFGKSTQDGTPTPDNPVEIVNTPAPVVTVCGKNLLRWPVHEPNITRNGVTYAGNADGSVSISGVASANGSWWVANYEEYLPKGTYTLSGIFTGISDASQLYAYVTDRAASKTLAIIRPTKAATTFTLAEDLQAVGISMAIPQAETVDGKVWLQLERGAVANEYEQPKTTQRVTITAPDGLPGIPVASGGNYTDANGQQWIADEVDLARGVYVQRVKEIIFDGTESWTLGNYDGAKYLLFVLGAPGITDGATGDMCTHATHATWCAVSSLKGNDFFVSPHVFFSSIQAGVEYTSAADWRAYLATQYTAGNPVKILYARATPVETALTDAEVQAYLAMQSYKPTTTVLNDAGAHMALEYAADPKTFICNQIAAAIAAK